MRRELFGEALGWNSVAVARRASGYEPAIDNLHFSPLKLLRHINAVGRKRAGGIEHAAHRASAVGFRENDAACIRHVARRREAAAPHGGLGQIARDLADASLVGGLHPGDGV